MFLSKKLNDLKRLGIWLKENIRFFFAVFPVLTTLLFMILFYYLLLKSLSLIFWSDKFDSLCDSASQTIWYCLAPILEFVFNNLGMIAITLGFIVLGAIYDFFQKEKMKKRLPIIGIPNKDNVTVLLALFNLRCLEIGTLYSIVRDFQKRSGKENWIESFLVEMLNNHNIGSNLYMYGDRKEINSREQKNRENAIKLLKEKFNFSENWYSENENRSLQDLMTAVKLHYKIHDINGLRGFIIFGQFQGTIYALINEYIKFYSNPSILFIYDKPFLGYLKNRTHESQMTIDAIWEEIICALKYSLIFLKMKNDSTFNIDELLNDIKALQILQNKIANYSILKRKNDSDGVSLLTPDKEAENLILSKIERNLLNDLY